MALANAGSNIAARMAMMAMTTRSSIKVKALVLVRIGFFIGGIIRLTFNSELLCILKKSSWPKVVFIFSIQATGHVVIVILRLLDQASAKHSATALNASEQDPWWAVGTQLGFL